MTREIKITVTSPIECTEEQFKEWVEYCTHYMAGMSISNPLHEYDMEADSVEINY